MNKRRCKFNFRQNLISANFDKQLIVFSLTIKYKLAGNYYACGILITTLFAITNNIMENIERRRDRNYEAVT